MLSDDMSLEIQIIQIFAESFHSQIYILTQVSGFAKN